MNVLMKFILALIALPMLISCVKSEQDEMTIPTYFLSEHIQELFLQDVRLADGAPLDIQISYRWKIADIDSFQTQFAHPETFDSLILGPRAQEIADLTSVKFLNIDSVFTTQRSKFVSDLRQELLFGLGGNEAIVKEVIITRLKFPSKYTKALEDISLKKKEIERIEQQARVDLAQSEANKKKAKLDGQVRIAKAESEGKLASIQAATEKSRRASQLALAETQSQVQEIQAKAQAKAREIALQVELEKDRKANELERQDLIARNDVALLNEKKKNELASSKKRQLREQKMELDKKQRQYDFDMEVTFAELCASNPVYADYLVHKELASHVEIAILPTDTEMGLFEDLMKNTVTKRQ